MGKEPHPKWTIAKIKDRIQTEAAGRHPALQEWSDHLKKEGRQDRAKRVGLETSGHETKGRIRIMIHDETERTTASKVSDVGGSGELSALYYVRWVMEEDSEDSGCRLRRMAAFLTGRAAHRRGKAPAEGQPSRSEVPTTAESPQLGADSGPAEAQRPTKRRARSQPKESGEAACQADSSAVITITSPTRPAKMTQQHEIATTTEEASPRGDAGGSSP